MSLNRSFVQNTANSIKPGVYKHEDSKQQCGMCKFCLDKLKYWGPGKKKQCCIKQCMKADTVSLSSTKRKETSEGKKQGAVSQPYVSVSFAIEDYISVETLPHYLLESGRKLHQVKGDVPFLITPSPGEWGAWCSLNTFNTIWNLNHLYFEPLLISWCDDSVSWHWKAFKSCCHNIAFLYQSQKLKLENNVVLSCSAACE